MLVAHCSHLTRRFNHACLGSGASRFTGAIAPTKPLCFPKKRCKALTKRGGASARAPGQRAYVCARCPFNVRLACSDVVRDPLDEVWPLRTWESSETTLTSPGFTWLCWLWWACAPLCDNAPVSSPRTEDGSLSRSIEDDVCSGLINPGAYYRVIFTAGGVGGELGWGGECVWTDAAAGQWD